MKKLIIIELFLLVTLAQNIYINVKYIDAFIAFGYYNNPLAIFNFISTFTTLIAIVLTFVFNFPAFKPLLDKLNARREQRAQAKAEKAEADKQEKIKALEQQLEELKKD